MITLCHQTKTPFNFWYKRELNPKSHIQSSEILLVELTGTHNFIIVIKGLHHTYKNNIDFTH